MCFLLFMIALIYVLERRQRIDESSSPYCYHSHQWNAQGGKAAVLNSLNSK